MKTTNVLSMNNPIPEYLQSLYDLLSSAFPNGIASEHYLPVLFMLYEYMSDRNLAEIVGTFTGKNCYRVLNDVYRIGSSDDIPSQEHIESVKKKLMEHGFEEWTQEE